MATIDEDDDVLVVRVVYDGAPLCGKTTTLRALAKSLGVAVTTPEEREGRTLFFDWVDYVGGVFDGRQIRCQIISVPGQRDLGPRRQHLLDAADVVVLVVDTRAAVYEAALSTVRQRAAACRETDPPLGLILQANKRDHDSAVPRARMFADVETIAPVAIVETVATTGQGVREGFVFAVRLALDRVRALVDRGALPRGKPEAEHPLELLDQLKTLPLRFDPAPTLAPPAPDRPAPRSHISVPPTPIAPSDIPEVPFVPDPLMPSGTIWPPVDGRALLGEVAGAGLLPRRTASGDWSAAGAGWRLHSHKDALFGDVDAGRRALIQWARVHTQHERLLSPGRAVVLADAGEGRVRLWQLVRVVRSLREQLTDGLAHLSAEDLAHRLVDTAASLLSAQDAWTRAEVALTCSLWTVGTGSDHAARFVGLLPAGAARAPVQHEAGHLLRREFAPVLRAAAEERDDLDVLAPAVQRGLARRGMAGAEAFASLFAQAAPASAPLAPDGP